MDYECHFCLNYIISEENAYNLLSIEKLYNLSKKLYKLCRNYNMCVIQGTNITYTCMHFCLYRTTSKLGLAIRVYVWPSRDNFRLFSGHYHGFSGYPTHTCRVFYHLEVFIFRHIWFSKKKLFIDEK